MRILVGIGQERARMATDNSCNHATLAEHNNRAPEVMQRAGVAKCFRGRAARLAGHLARLDSSHLIHHTLKWHPSIADNHKGQWDATWVELALDRALWKQTAADWTTTGRATSVLQTVPPPAATNRPPD